MVTREKSPQPEPLGDREDQVRRPGRAGTAVLRRERSAQRDPAVRVHHLDRRLELRAAGVVEVHVDAAGSGLPEPVGELAVVVVERGVETELLDQVGDLGR